jgi:5-methylthioadenosine/S-adenosylhomocysteine deaminase
MFARAGAKVVHNPESNMKLASGVAPVPDLQAAGVTVALGTDGCASNNNLDMFQEMDTAAKLHKAFRLDPTVMSAGTVLKMATRDGARALGMGEEVGSLQPGMKADVITVDFNSPHLTPVYSERSHLVYCASGSDVDTVVINGRIVMRNRKILTVDEEEVMDRVNRIARRIRASLGM